MAKGISFLTGFVSSAKNAGQAARKAKYLAQQTAPMTVPQSFLDTFQKTVKAGRSVDEQIAHLKSTYSGASVKGNYYVNSTRQGSFNGELFTRQGDSNRWIKIDDELYFIREESNSPLHKFFDDIYSKLNIQNLKPAKEAKLGHGWNPGDDIRLYKYIEQDAKIIDNPSLIDEGFGLDCLLSTPLTNKSVIVKNGKAIRLENGLMQYFADIGNGRLVVPKSMITGDIHISSYFANGTESANILRNMNEKDLLNSLRKLEQIDAKTISDFHKGNGTARIGEQLLIKKDNLKTFADLMEKNPKMPNESMFEYTQRIENMIPKQKPFTAPIDDFVLKTEPDSVLRPIEDNWQSFQRVSKQKFSHDSTPVIADGTFTHNANVEDIESVLDNGLLSGQATLCKTAAGSTVSGNWTTTPGQFDTFIVKGEQTIQDYFNLAKRHSYEADFMRPDYKISYIINKDRVKEFHNSYLPRPDQKGLNTHYTFPFGLPINTVDRIVVSPNLSKAELNKVISSLQKRNLDIKVFDRNGKMLYEMPKTKLKPTVNRFLSTADNLADNLLGKYRFDLFGKKGVPLSYPRKEFINDIGKVIQELPINERAEFLKKFGLTLGNHDIDGIPNISGFVAKTSQEQKMVSLIEKFYKNEVTIQNPQMKPILDDILKEFPEFGFAIGKVQHGTHDYSVDIHSLKLLQNAVLRPEYVALSDESKLVLKLTALMHDFGKKGNAITSGHAKLSREYAERILAQHNISDSIKTRVLNQIENHHWFEAYNTGRMTARDFGRIFPSTEDKTIAKLVARGDFESVNPNFHLGRLVAGKQLTKAEYERMINLKMEWLI